MAAALLVGGLLAVQAAANLQLSSAIGSPVGATYVTAVFLLLPEIGAAATIGLTVAGQQLASLLADQFGLLRLPRRSLTRPRLAGVALLLAGVALIQLT